MDGLKDWECMVLRIVSGWFEGLGGDGLKDCEWMVCRVWRGWF